MISLCLTPLSNLSTLRKQSTPSLQHNIRPLEAFQLKNWWHQTRGSFTVACLHFRSPRKLLPLPAHLKRDQESAEGNYQTRMPSLWVTLNAIYIAHKITTLPQTQHARWKILNSTKHYQHVSPFRFLRTPLLLTSKETTSGPREMTRANSTCTFPN